MRRSKGSDIASHHVKSYLLISASKKYVPIFLSSAMLSDRFLTPVGGGVVRGDEKGRNVGGA